MKYLATFLLFFCLKTSFAQSQMNFNVLRHDFQQSDKHQYERSDAPGQITITMDADSPTLVPGATGIMIVRATMQGQAAPYTFAVKQVDRVENKQIILLDMLPQLNTGTLFQLTLFDELRQVNETKCTGTMATNLGTVDLYYLFNSGDTGN